MPITIDYSKTVWYKDAQEQMRETMEQQIRRELSPKIRQEVYQEMQLQQRDQVKLLTKQLEKRFGQLPHQLIQEKINAATMPELEKWGLEFIDAKKLEDIFQLY